MNVLLFLAMTATAAEPRPTAPATELETCIKALPADFLSGSAWADDVSSGAASSLLPAYGRYQECLSTAGKEPSPIPDALRAVGASPRAPDPLAAFYRACASGEEGSMLASGKTMIKEALAYYLPDDADWDGVSRAWCSAYKSGDQEACRKGVEKFASPRYKDRDGLIKMCRESSGLDASVCKSLPKGRDTACAERAALAKALRGKDETGAVCMHRFALSVAVPLCKSKVSR